MSDLKLSRHQKRRQSRKTHSPELRARQARTLLVVEASKAVIASYRDTVVSECNAALAMLAELEPFTEGGVLPRRAARFASAFRGVADVVSREQGIGALCELTRDVMHVAVAEAGVLESYVQALGLFETPIEVSFRRIREELGKCSPGNFYLNCAERAFRAPLGGIRSHSELVGCLADEMDRVVITSNSQWAWLRSAKDALDRPHTDRLESRGKGQATHA